MNSGGDLTEAERARFQRLMLPHLDAAYALAYWLTRHEDEARDAVQEGYLRALRFFGSFRGEDGRGWLLKIVRNACHELRHQERHAALAGELDEAATGSEQVAVGAVIAFPRNPEAAAIERAEGEVVQRCLRSLPREFREVIVLRELHEFSYKEIAAIAGIPLGTVMSRLARARRLMLARLTEAMRHEDTGT
jgi:RNA polymerase sigma-70 factor (ECF subfamily)